MPLEPLEDTPPEEEWNALLDKKGCGGRAYRILADITESKTQKWLAAGYTVIEVWSYDWAMVKRASCPIPMHKACRVRRPGRTRAGA